MLRLLRTALSAALLALGAHQAGSAGIPLPQARPYTEPRVAEASAPVKDWVLTSGALTVTFDEGAAAYLLVDGKPAGLYVKGTGAFRHRTTDPAMKPTLLFNLEQNTRLKAAAEGADLVVGEPITEAIFWFAGRAVPELPAATLPSLAESYAPTAERFGERDQVPRAAAPDLLHRLPLAQLMAYRALNGLTQPVVTAELMGATERFVYTYDAAYARTETLFIQSPLAIHTLRSIVLAQAPIGWPRTAPPDPDYHLTHLDLELVASQRSEGRMTLVETLQAIRPGLRGLAFKFRFKHTVERTLGYEGLAEAVLHSVRGEDGRDLPFDLRGSTLLVDLGRALRSGETLKLRFAIDGPILDDESRGKLPYWRLTPGSHWFPEPDVAGRGFTVRAKVSVEKPFVAVASARTVGRFVTATHNVLQTSLEQPIQGFSIAAGRYEPVEMPREGRIVRAWFYSGIPAGAERFLRTAHSYLEFYDQLLTGFPFKEINLVEVPSLLFEPSPAGLVWLTKDVFNAADAPGSRLQAGYGSVGGVADRFLAHELAHPYWAHRLKAFTEADAWLSEGFAEYSAGLAIRAQKNKGAAAYDLIVADWKARAAVAAPHGTLPTSHLMQPAFAGKEPGPLGDDHPHALLHFKGAYLLASLHQTLGEDAFLGFLRSYQKAYAWYPPSTSRDVPDQLRKATGRDYAPWMDDNFWGTGMPAWQPRKAK